MNISFVTNLQKMACVQIADPIINSSKIRYLIDSYSPGYLFSENIEISKKIEKLANRKIFSLRLATALQKMVQNCVVNMISQVIECKNTYSLILTECANHVNQNFTFFWKYDGTIDQEKTVKALIENQDLNIKERFVLASSFCLVEDALRLWKTMVEAQIHFTPLELECQPLVKLWIETFEVGSLGMNITPQILESSVLQSNVCLLRYAMQMLPWERKRSYLLRTAMKNEISNDVMVFCLSQLDMPEQETILKNSAIKVLQCILTWPYQYLFMKVANYLWEYLSSEDFCDILWLFLLKIMQQEWSDFRLIEILKEFWFESPVHFKEHAKQQSIIRPLLIVLKCDMRSFPRYELSEACIESLEKLIQRICAF